MLLIKTYLDKSTIPKAGIGLFAGEDIQKGQQIWRFEEDLDIRIKMEDMPLLKKVYPLLARFLYRYCYVEDGHYILCIDDGRFINHSVNCNIDDSRPYLSYANRNIQKGEELLSDYGKMAQEDKENKLNLKF